jgi:hypothetical protein
MRKVYLYTNFATLLGFNNYMMFQKKMVTGCMQHFSEACAEINIKEYGDFKTFSAESVMMDPSIKEVISASG